MARTVLRNATIVTVDRTLGVLKNCDLLIDGENISAIRPELDAQDTHVIDATDMIVMPGLINAHKGQVLEEMVVRNKACVFQRKDCHVGLD